MNRTRIAALGILAASAALLAGVACGDDDGGSEATASATTAAAASPSASAAPSSTTATGTATASTATATTPAGTAATMSLEVVLTEAINEEYKAHATYQAVIDKFGDVAPFNNIIKAEQSHIDAWKRLFTANNLPIPADPFAGKVVAPETLKAACEAGVAAEKEDVALYDRLMSATTDAQVLAVMQQQRAVSQENHLPAFEACAR